jgi:hypothetical protein
VPLSKRHTKTKKIMNEYLLKTAKEEVAHRITMYCLTEKLNPVKFFKENKEAIEEQIEQEFEGLKELYKNLKK